MKPKSILKVLFMLALLSLPNFMFGQSPEAFQYQAVIRNADGSPLQNTSITLTISISNGGGVVYSETHSKTTNEYGLVTTSIGGGNTTSGSMSGIKWGSDTHFLSVSMNDGINTVNMGTTQILSVPYALEASHASSLTLTSPNGTEFQITVDDNGNISFEDLQPVVSVSATPTSGVEALVVVFNAIGSNGNGTLNYSWTFGDGGTSTEQSPTYTYNSAGTYVARCTVTDADGDEDTDNITITVIEDLQPVATVGATPESGLEPLEVSFSLVVSSGNLPISYAWNFGDGGSSSAQNPTHTYLSHGSYNVSCTVTDANGDTDTNNITIIVDEDLIPTVTATAIPTSGTSPLAVEFSAVGSNGNGNLSYSWSFGDGGTSTAQTPAHTYATHGSYTATCTVTDEDGDSNSDNVIITVGEDLSPTVAITATPTSGTAALEVSFTATPSGGNGNPTYAWDFGDGSGTSTDQNPSYTYTTHGSYTATCTVTDEDGDTGSDSETINVAEDLTPTVAITATPTSGTAALVVSFTATPSGGNGNPTYAWDFGDGSGTSSDQNPSYTYTTHGSYIATCTVTDEDGDTGSDSETINVAEDLTPTVAITATPTSGTAALEVNFTATPSGGNGNATYAWDFGDGSGTSTEQNPTYTYTTHGSYTATCTVTDEDGDTGSDSETITVNEGDDINSGLVAYYPFNGGSVLDESGNGNNGTNNGASQTTDRFGVANCAYSFDGQSYISTPLNNIEYSEIAFSLWICSSGGSVNDAGILCSRGEPTEITGFTITDNSLRLWIAKDYNSNVTIVDSSGVINGEWHHIYGSHNGSESKLYIDGSIAATNNFISIQKLHGDLNIGLDAYSPIRKFVGLIDDIRIYDRALSPTEIQELYTEGCTAAPAQPGTITGETNVSENQQGVGYSIAAVDNAISYEWSVTGDASITNGQGTTEITVDFGTGNSTITVKAVNPCGESAAETLTVTVGTPSIDESNIPTDGLIAHYELDDDAQDNGPNGLHGTVSGATGTTDRNGVVNGALNFDGNDYVEILSHDSLQTRNVKSAFAWVQFTGTANNPYQIINKYKQNEGSVDGYQMSLALGRTYTMIASVKAYNTQSAALTNNAIDTSWFHIGYVYKDSIVCFYINGDSISSGSANTGYFTDNSHNLYIGCGQRDNAHDDYYFVGKIDDVVLYNKPLSTVEINELYTENASFATAPAVTTGSATSITSSSVTLGGNVTNDGGASITDRGIVYHTESGFNAEYEGTAKSHTDKTTGSFTIDVSGLTPSTTYYYVAYASNSEGITLGSEESFTTSAPPATAPAVTTGSATNLTSSTVTLGGNVTSDGGATVTARGIEYSNDSNFTEGSGIQVADTIAGTGEFTVDVTTLSAATTYYYRAYATNSAGTAYGEKENFTTGEESPAGAGTVTDYDGNVYQTVTIGTQTWMAENLRVTHFPDGTPIPLVTDLNNNGSTNDEWDALGNDNRSPAYCWYNDDPANKTTYGALYTYAAATNGDGSGINVQGGCPTGWHLPSTDEFQTLFDYIASDGHANDPSSALRASTGWENQNGTDNYGFAMPGSGQRLENDVRFLNLNNAGYLWSSTMSSVSQAYFKQFSETNSSINQYARNKGRGFSVRCIKNEE